ncbi:MAG: sigma-54 dependent transcriptional regulator [bacterium]
MGRPRGEGPLILIAEDDAGMRDLLTQILAEDGYRVVAVEDGQQAVLRLKREEPRALLTDLKMPRMDGMELLRWVVRERPGLPVVVLTAFGSVPGAVEAMRLGAFDFLSKPLPTPGHLRQVMERALASGHGVGRGEPVPQGIVCEDPAFCRVMELVRAVADRDTTVLVTGESGTGKEVVARALHSASPRGSGPYVALNCAAIPESLLESELFGHDKGAFTGAVSGHPGMFEQAAGGTLLLDEIGEMQPALQAKLLRVLETRRVTRLGGTKEISVDVRVVAATNRELEAEVGSGRFRQDLFFRLNVFPIRIPPLRERAADILPLARHFLAILGASPGRTVPTLAADAEAALQAHPWPGNVRELQNAMERATILAPTGELLPEHLGLSTVGGAVPAGDAPGARSTPPGADSGLTLKDLERRAIVEALAVTGGNRRKAAKRLGIALRTLQYKLKEYEIS